MNKRTIEIKIEVTIGGKKYQIHDKKKYHEDWDLESVAASELDFFSTQVRAALEPCFFNHERLFIGKED
jgi:hypothetical protein